MGAPWVVEEGEEDGGGERKEREDERLRDSLQRVRKRRGREMEKLTRSNKVEESVPRSSASIILLEIRY